MCIPPATLRAMERAAPGAARIDLAAALLSQARDLVTGVILTTPEDDPTALAPLLAAVS